MFNNVKNKKFVIYGASGHGKVIADIIEKGKGIVLAFIDDNEHLWGTSFCGYPVWGGGSHLIQATADDTFFVIIGIGDNPTRYHVWQNLEKAGLRFGTAVHPSARLGKGVVIGKGTVVMANCVINADARVGSHCIINTAANIDHDCIIGDFVHISPGVNLGGSVCVDALSWVGLGACVSNKIHIGEQTIIGAGSVVIRNVAQNTVVVGNPAAFLRETKKTI